MSKQHIFTGSGAPTSTPTGYGHHYVDTVSNVLYLSKGISSPSDWQVVGSGGGFSFPIQAPTQVLADPPNYGFGGGDNDTGMWSSGDGNISFSANGFLRLEIEQNESTFHGNLNVLSDLIVTGNISAANYPYVPPGSSSRLVKKDSAGDQMSAEPMQLADDDTFGFFADYQVNNFAGGKTAFGINPRFLPQQNSPDDTWNAFAMYLQVDPNSSGFTFGTNGTAINVINTNTVHNGTGNIGTLNLLTQNFGLGNGTDPITVEGVGYSFGFGSINANVTIADWIQGYGFQPSMNASATMNGYITAFYDNANIQTAVGGYTSANFSPTVSEIKNNNGFTGINLNPNIASHAGNAGSNGLAVAGTYEGFTTGGFSGVNINPTSTDNSASYVNGIYVSVDNFTVKAGSQSSVVIQDLTVTFNAVGNNNAYSIQYFDTGTAGAETVILNGNNIEVSMEDGVSTASQIKAAIEATIGLNSAVTVTISGVGANTQVVAGPISFSGGSDAGNKKAGYFDGDVEITGSLTFGGALSIGKLNAYATQAMINGGGTPTSVHQLISAPTVADNTTVALADTMGINTAMLLQIGVNSTVTTALLGASALALPAVVALGAGSTIDLVAGATFAVSLQGGGAGTIDQLPLCRSVAIPNGTTTINKLYGYKFDLPFGDPGTDSWGFYESPGKNNYFAGNLLIGGTAGSDDVVTNGSVAFEIKSTTKAAVLSRMTTAERDSLTAIDGMVLYNTTTDKFQGYANGVWVDLH